MEIMVYVVGLILIALAVYQMYKVRKNLTISEDAWQEIRIVGYRTIDDLMKLYSVSENEEDFIDYVIDEIKEKIDTSKALTSVDRDFWSKENLTSIFRPVLVGLIRKLDTIKK